MSFIDYRQETKTGFGRNLAPAPVNDPQLFTPTHCRVIKLFCVSGKPVEIGSVITLPAHDAESLKAINKVEIITET